MTREKDLYPAVVLWLGKLLRRRFKTSIVVVEDTSQFKLSTWLERKGIISRIRYGAFFDFKVDVTAAIVGEKGVRLYLIECKIKPITIKDLSQILGYSRIVNPYRAAIISPFGASKNLFRLIMVSGRSDVLYFSDDQEPHSLIRICKWDIGRSDIDYSGSIPLGFHP